MRKPSLMRHSSDVETELNITPIMNLFVILIPFLLLSAVFIQVAVVPNSIPNIQAASSPKLKEKKTLELQLIMNNAGYTIIGRGGVLDLGSGKKFKGSTIPKVNGEFDALTLNKVLYKIRQAHPSKAKDEPLIVYPKANVKYQEIIQTMDAARELWDEGGQLAYKDGQDEEGNTIKVTTELFPNVVIGAELVEQ